MKPNIPKSPKSCLDPCRHEGLARIYRALGHPVRLAIVERLARHKGACCGDIVDLLPLAQSTVSQHLQVLKDAGLLDCHSKGRTCEYRLNQDRLREAADASRVYFAALLVAEPDKPAPPEGTQSGTDPFAGRSEETVFD